MFAISTSGNSRNVIYAAIAARAKGAKVISLTGRTGGELLACVVDDQIGSPTYTADLAALLCDMALSGKYGVYHASNEGYCSWADFAAEIVRLGASGCRINPIPSSQYPTIAIRPKNSRLSKASLEAAGFSRLPHWKDALVRFMSQGGFV